MLLSERDRPARFAKRMSVLDGGPPGMRTCDAALPLSDAHHIARGDLAPGGLARRPQRPAFEVPIQAPV